MPLRRPKPNRTYWFVRLNGTEVDWCALQCYADGSAMTADSEYNTIYENAPNLWEQALGTLANDGFVLHADSLAAGDVSPDAEPPAELADFYGWPGSDGAS